MNRKNTILLAVLINAGLLLVLFISALTSQEEIAIAPTHEMSSRAPSLQEPLRESGLPLFGDEIDLAINSPKKEPHPEHLPQVLPEIKHSEPSIVHSLPPVAAPETPTVAPVQAPLAVRSREGHGEGLQEVTVKKGDTLEKIAKAHRTTVDEMIRVNQLPSSFLRVGQILKLPAEKSVAAKAQVKPQLPESASQSPEYYTVKVGDNPWSIAMKHHLKVEELLKLNALNEEKARKLKPGDRLRIRA